jgi:hypothetical protein
MNGFRFISKFFAGFQQLLLVTLVISLSACATDLRQQVFHNIVIKNVGKNRITDIYVDYGHPYRIEDKMIPPGAQTTEGMDVPIPLVMRVVWATQNGKKTGTLVELKKNLEYATRLRAVEIWINEEELEVYQATPRGAQEEFTDRKRIYPR